MNNARTTLFNVFGHREFKSRQQEDAVSSVLDRIADVMVLFPTGAGKSLIYQLPALCVEGKFTVVVSPLIALINDQVEGLRMKGVTTAEAFNSKMEKESKERVLTDLKSDTPTTKIVFSTPEMLMTKTFKNILTTLNGKNKLGWIVVDEVHCVSQWGYDFRKEYGKLGELREVTGDTPWIGLTATATEKVQHDIRTVLKFRPGYHVFKLPSSRTNIFYDVVYKCEKDVGDSVSCIFSMTILF